MGTRSSSELSLAEQDPDAQASYASQQWPPHRPSLQQVNLQHFVHVARISVMLAFHSCEAVGSARRRDGA